MKTQFTLIMLILFGISPLLAQNDCSDAITVCGNTGFTGLNATGGGNIDEIFNGNNDCSVTSEANSLWLRLPINTSGTLGFTLTPLNPDIDIDFDFYIFGPNATCGNLGHTIRCSTTNPAAAGSSSNQTGMNDVETDTSEGPGEFGNNFLQWLTVQAGEVYYLVIDRPINPSGVTLDSDFSIEWTGTATFYASPEFVNPQLQSTDIVKCDDDAIDDQMTLFDLTTNETMFLAGQPDVVLTYHHNINDVITGENPIANPSAYTNTSNPETIYMRMSRTTTECFVTDQFEIEVTNPVTAGEPDNLELCDFNETGKQKFNLTTNDALIRNGNSSTSVTYYASQSNAQQKVNPLPGLYETGTTTIWARLESTATCQGHDIVSFTVTVTPLPDIIYTLDVKDLTEDDNSIAVVMDNEQDYEFAIDNSSFSDNPLFTRLETGPHTVYIKAKSGCKTVSEEVIILNYPKFFTPNGDNENEVWRIPYLNLHPNAQVTIFDRYGKIITGFTGSGSWDGTFNDSKLPSTDYWFVLQLTTGRIIRGHFSMIR
ncbi:T9SS type B sorting domain-containing protein [Flavobacterium suzhouense]|uniref:T9SS type B sorting domain-containing protein n=1 Tax=Flavobacterium suzhouense TaxID=1529638 RepID=A0ABW5NT58_9FLAO